MTKDIKDCTTCAWKSSCFGTPWCMIGNFAILNLTIGCSKWKEKRGKKE